MLCNLSKRFITVASLLCFILVSDTFACTTFCLKGNGEMLFGRNYDWMIGDGLVFVNKRGMQKTSITEDAKNPAKWTSKYGSVTFNQYGRENPMGGMNETGLVIELMWLDGTKYPPTDGRPTVDVLEWIQYQLDTASTVEDVLKNAKALRIKSDVTLHYLVNDRAGNTATIEFLDGGLVTNIGYKLDAVLANDTYDKSLNYLNTTPSEKAITESSLDRFTRAARRAKEFEKQPKSGQEAVSYAFDILENVAQKGHTQWSIVYDQKRGKIYFRSLQSSTIKSIDTKTFDYSCGTAIKIFNVNSKDNGEVTAKFTDYSTKANRDLIEQSYSNTPFLKGVTSTAKDFFASYPNNFGCSSKTMATQGNDIRTNVLSLPPIFKFLANYINA